MEVNSEVRKIKVIAIFFMVVALASLAVVVLSLYIPYSMRSQELSVYKYFTEVFPEVFQEMPAPIISLATLSVIQGLLLFAFYGVFRLKERARKAVVLISIGGIVIYVSLFILSKILEQELPAPIKDCVIPGVLIYFFTRPKVKAQFK